jgi:TatA/E family protein of Tat protein translocase
MGQNFLLIGYFGVGPSEMIVLMVVALLLYGGDLPKVARSWGKSIAEFKKGMSGIQNEFNSVFYDETPRIPYHDPVYSHNAGTIDGHLADETAAEEAVGAAVETSVTEAASPTESASSSAETTAASDRV